MPCPRDYVTAMEGTMQINQELVLDFAELLDASVKIHGHLCAGQVLGVRMSMLGLGVIGILDPKGNDRKNIIVFVEMDRCATDAVQSVTGCSLGKRSMKFMDYGKMAATFLNLKTNKAVRIVAREDSRQKAKERFPEIENKYAGQLEAYKVMSDEELFVVMEVVVNVAPEDMPGRPMRRVQCDSCGEHVQDLREVYRDGRKLCVPCAGGGYYDLKAPSLSPPKEAAPQTGQACPLPSGERIKMRGSFYSAVRYAEKS